MPTPSILIATTVPAGSGGYASDPRTLVVGNTQADPDSSSSSSSSESSASSASSNSSSSSSRSSASSASSASSHSSVSTEEEITFVAPLATIQVHPAPFSAEIVWLKPADQNVQPVGYLLYRNSILIYEGTDTRFTDRNLTIRDTYNYAVAAYDGEANTSELVEATPLVLGPQMSFDQNQNEPPTISIADVDLGQVVPTDQLVYHHIKVPTLRGPVTVTLASSFSNVQLRYTLNGKNPAPTSNLYTGPLTLRQNMTGEKTALKARAFDKTNAGFKSKIIRAEFRIIPSH